MKVKIAQTISNIGCFTFFAMIGFFIYLMIKGQFITAFVIGISLFILSIILINTGNHVIEKDLAQQCERLYHLQPNDRLGDSAVTYVASDARSKLTLDLGREIAYMWVPKENSSKKQLAISSKTVYTYEQYRFNQLLMAEFRCNDEPIRVITRTDPYYQQLITELTEHHEATSNMDDMLAKGPIQTISLTLIFHNAVTPIHNMYFFKDTFGALTKNHKDYLSIIKTIDEAYAHLLFLIRESDRMNGYVYDNTIPTSQSLSTNDVELDSNLDMKKIAMIQTRLLPILAQVLHEKSTSIETTSYDSSNYFNEIVKRNTALLNRKNDEK